MCYHCHDQGHNPTAPAHRSKKCVDPTNPHGRCFAASSASSASSCSGGGGGGGGRKSSRAAAAPCSLCKSTSHAAADHKCGVCHECGHRGRDCKEVETEGLPGRTKVLFHETSEAGGKAIYRSQTFNPGSKGMFGAGIYFATSSADCVGKAHQSGVVLTAKVKLGRSLVCRKAATGMTLEKVKQRGCQSVKGESPAVTRPEYAVFEPWQVTSIRVREYRRRTAQSTAAGAVGGGGGAAFVVVPQAAWPQWVVDLDSMADTYQPPAPPSPKGGPATTHTGPSKKTQRPSTKTPTPSSTTDTGKGRGKGTVYSGKGRPKTSDYTASGKLRRAPPSPPKPAGSPTSSTTYRGKGRPRSTDYTPSGTIRRATRPTPSPSASSLDGARATLYQGRGRPRSTDYLPGGGVNYVGGGGGGGLGTMGGGGGGGGGGGATVYQGRGRPRSTDYLAGGGLNYG